MTRDEIISMAREAGLQSIEEHWGTVYRAVGPSNLEYFAGLVAAREREACARILEAQDIDPSFRNRMATAIRARAEKEAK